MKDFSKSWKASKVPKKQRKYRYNAPLHIRNKFLSANLSKELRDKHSRRNLPLRTGDRVRVMVGKFKKHLGKITRIDVKNLKVHIEGVEKTKREGTKSFFAIDPSNLEVVELELEDKKRRKILERVKGGKNE